MNGATLKRLLPQGRANRRILFGPARGAIMPLDLQYELRLYLGVYERELWPHYRSLLGRGMTAFDIGGRDGYSAILIHALTRGPVRSFEADAAAAEAMQKTFAMNGASIHAVAAFIGSDGLALDEAAERFGAPDFIKIDVEGGEADVLHSGRRLLDKKPRLIVEVHGRHEEADCIKLLGSKGYEISIVGQALFLKEHRPLPHNRWLVCR
jgi:hypothetical protein